MNSIRTKVLLWERMRSKVLEADLGGWDDLMRRYARRLGKRPSFMRRPARAGHATVAPARWN